jgi:hypothetical protein
MKSDGKMANPGDRIGSTRNVLEKRREEAGDFGGRRGF